MRIGINTRLLLPGELDGIGKFTSEVAYRLAASAPEHEFHWFFDRAIRLEKEPPSNVRTHVVHPPTRHPFLYYIWFEGTLPSALKEQGIERFFSPDGFLSLRSSIPAYPVIHDLNFEHYPEDLPFWTRRYYRRYFPRYARKAERVMTVSEYSAQDISERYGVDPARLHVVQNGVNDAFHPLSEEARKKVQKDWNDGTPYLIHVGSLHPRKNIARLLKAFDEVVPSMKERTELMLVGDRMWWTPEMDQALKGMRHHDHVRFIGHQDEETLNLLLSASEGLLYLSYFEGFGIPVLEAMKASVPVLCADRTSLPEVGGDAVLYTDPFEEGCIAQKMLELLQNDALRKELVEKGKARADAFTWDRVAEKVKATLDIETGP